jgi:hypothetical protein
VLRDVTDVVMTAVRKMVGQVRGETAPERVWNPATGIGEPIARADADADAVEADADAVEADAVEADAVEADEAVEVPVQPTARDESRTDLDADLGTDLDMDAEPGHDAGTSPDTGGRMA